jgi:hypothetical protein
MHNPARLAPVWRTRVVAGLIAALVFPAAALAETPGGFRTIGPPAMLNNVVFAGDGTAYGTVEFGGRPAKVAGSNVTVWRSNDHGHTWSTSYRAPDGAPLALIAASRVDPNTLYASIETATNIVAVERIDVATAKAIALPFARYLGEDAAGTAYGLTPDRPKSSYLVRCPHTTDTCDSVPVPLTVDDSIIVDPNSVGLLTSTETVGSDRHLALTRDAGASWSPGVSLGSDCACYKTFAGPLPGMLYVLGANLSLSLDGGASWAGIYPVNSGDAFILGSKPSAPLRIDSAKLALYSGEAGAPFRAIAFSAPARWVVVDPTDANHLVASGTDETTQSWDGGLTWNDLADTRFGTTTLQDGSIAASGRNLYAVSSGTAGSSSSLWLSDDMGANWTRQRRPSDERRFLPVVSRDDPRTAYMFTTAPSPTGTIRTELRTRDGGLTWTGVNLPASLPVYAVAPGEPLHVYAYGPTGQTTDVWESLGGGGTWTAVPLGSRCTFNPVDDPTSPTGQRLRCDGWDGFDPHVSLGARALPYAEDLSGSPDRPGAFSVVSDTLLGDVQSDWSWSQLLAPTGSYGPTLPSAEALAAWPAKGASTFVAYDPPRGMTWVRRGTTRWWRLQVSGRDLTFVRLLDSTHVLVRDTKSDGSPLAVVDLRRPTVDSPQVQQQPGGLACVVPWTSSEATTSGYAWLRDGVVLRGATRVQRPRSRYDRGHSLTCRATARNPWGSVTLSSSNLYPVAGTPAALPRVVIEDSAVVGTHLHCSARTHVSWVRDEIVIPGHHARTYTPRPHDADHAIACQTRLVDGTVVRSNATFVEP